MAKNKTRPTDATVEYYIAQGPMSKQRTDCQELMALLKKITQQPPKMWGPSIVEYGTYRYTLRERACRGGSSGGLRHSWPRTGRVSARRRRQTEDLVGQAWHAQDGEILSYFKRLSDLDYSVLEKLVTSSVAEVRRRYG